MCLFSTDYAGDGYSLLFQIKPFQYSIILIFVSRLFNIVCLNKLLVELELAE
jgi:hypothetical protein